MFVINWLYNRLASLGLLRKHATILLLGLDNTGKTTLLHMLRNCPSVHHPITEDIVIGNVSFTIYDLGDNKVPRSVWRNYFSEISGIVYLVDAADHPFVKSKAELDALLAVDQLSNVPFLILGNKIDAIGAVSEETLRQELGLCQTTGKQGHTLLKDVRPIEVFMCSVVMRQGYMDGFNWLSQYV